MKLKLLIVYVVVMVALLVTGCSDDTMENRGELLVAVAKHDMKKTVDLVESGVDVNYQSNPLMTGTLHACLAHSEENLELLNFLISNDANINMQNSEGSTPLKFAVVNGHLASIKYLLSQGADPSIPDRYGQKPTDYIDDYIDTTKSPELMDLSKP